jgi:hypothetical protein
MNVSPEGQIGGGSPLVTTGPRSGNPPHFHFPCFRFLELEATNEQGQICVFGYFPGTLAYLRATCIGTVLQSKGPITTLQEPLLDWRAWVLFYVPDKMVQGPPRALPENSLA